VKQNACTDRTFHPPTKPNSIETHQLEEAESDGIAHHVGQHEGLEEADGFRLLRLALALSGVRGVSLVAQRGLGDDAVE
jgi:hypothetical protein